MARGLQVWSKTASSNSTADTGVNWAEGMAPSAVNDSARAEMASAAMYRDDNNGSLTGTLATATYSVTSNQTAAALTADYTIAFQIDTAMPATALLNLDALGAKPLRPYAGTDFVGGEYKANSIIRATYKTTNSGEWIVQGAASILPAGLGPLPYAGATAPSGWLFCYGQSLLRASYVALFAAIGTTYGAADGIHFSLPDMRGRVAAGKDDMGGTSANRLATGSMTATRHTLGGAGGADVHTLLTTEMPIHTHTATVTDPGHVHGTKTGTGVTATYPIKNNGTLDGSLQDTTSATTGITVANSTTGSDLAHNNLQPTIITNYIIYAGV